MTIATKHNKAITVAGEVVKTVITYAIYIALLALVLVGLLYVGIFCGDAVHNILN